MNEKFHNEVDEKGEKQPLTARYTPSSLELKLKRQRDKMRNSSDHQKINLKSSSSQTAISTPPKRTTSLLAAARLHIPNKKSGYQKLENSALVDLNLSDDDSDCFNQNFNQSERRVRGELSRQLKRDGFRLDEISDDEDLDLIPPQDFSRTPSCWCCNAYNVRCNIM